MQKQRLRMSKLTGIILLIVTLLSVTLVRNVSSFSESRKKLSVSESNAPVKSNEVLLKNVALEAVVPFLHVDFLHHFIISPFVCYSDFTTEISQLPIPGYINKYLKNL